MRIKRLGELKEKIYKLSKQDSSLKSCVLKNQIYARYWCSWNYIAWIISCFSVVKPVAEESYVRRIEFTVQIGALGNRYL